MMTVKSKLPYTTHFLVIGGGGSGGWASSGTTYRQGGGGGAGGYRTSYGTSGGGASAESPLTFEGGVTYTLTVGDGATAQTSNYQTHSSCSLTWCKLCP